MKICKNGQKGERKHEIRKTDKKNRNALHDCSYCGLPGRLWNRTSEKFDEDKVKEAAKAIVEKVNAGNLKEVYEDSFTPVMQTVWL